VAAVSGAKRTGGLLMAGRQLGKIGRQTDMDASGVVVCCIVLW